MKRFFFQTIFILISSLVVAQEIPTDPKVKVGKLSNGLTYIIRHNEKPARQADFYIAQKVGSILEEDNQRGLAHFLEHMCFNGTKHFPGKSMINYLESIGVKFGANLNAYTSVDETVYNISNAPVTRETVIDSCLLILADWSCGLTLDPKEIDAERGVIHEEWRTRDNAQMRMMNQLLPKVYQNSKYAYRMPIGTMEVVDNFKPQALRAYYEKWYRPDQQAVIVVGDIDVDKVEQKIKRIFSPIKMPANPAKREYVPVEDNIEPIVAIARDKEMTSTQFSVMFKHDPIPVNVRRTQQYYAISYALSMVQQMLNVRLADMTRKPTCAFLSASVSNGNFWLSSNKEAFSMDAGCKEDSILPAMKAVTRELQRAARYGFTEAEFERAKSNYLQMYEMAYQERGNLKTDAYSKEYVRFFTQDEPSVGIEKEYEIMKALVPQIPLTYINKMMADIYNDQKNMVIVLFCPDKKSFTPPTESQLLAAYREAKAEKISAYVDAAPKEPLMKDKPAPGKIIKEKPGKFGSTELTLSNGVRVIIKPTDFKADQVSFVAFSPGGSSLFDTKDLIQISVMNEVAGLGGLGKFSNEDLQKMLAGNTASVGAKVSGLSEGISGGCTNKDLETMMQLIYLKFTAPRKDMEAFETFKQKLKTQLERMEAQPRTALSDSITFALYSGNPRSARIKADWVDQIDYDKCMEMYRDRYKDASDFTFVFVGNIDLDKWRPLINTYLASLPSIKRKENWKDNKVYIRKGHYTNDFQKDLETKKATVFILRSGNVKYSLRNNLLLSMMAQALNTIYLEEVREKEGGTYGVQVSGSLSYKPRQEALLQIQFDTDPARRERMTQIINEQLDKFCQTGPSAESLQKIKEYMLKQYNQNQKENGYWMGKLLQYYQDGFDTATTYLQTVKDITGEDIRKFATDLLKQGNDIRVSMSDERP